MAEHMDKRIFGGANQALGCLGFALRKALMNARHHHIEFCEQIIFKIQFAFV